MVIIVLCLHLRERVVVRCQIKWIGQSLGRFESIFLDGSHCPCGFVGWSAVHIEMHSSCWLSILTLLYFVPQESREIRHLLSVMLLQVVQQQQNISYGDKRPPGISLRNGQIVPWHVVLNYFPIRSQGLLRNHWADTLVICCLLWISAWTHSWEMLTSVAMLLCVINQSVTIISGIWFMVSCDGSDQPSRMVVIFQVFSATFQFSSPLLHHAVRRSTLH